MSAFDRHEESARALDLADGLRPLRARFHVPQGSDGVERAYLCGNSLGLAPRAAAGLVAQELDDWAERGVDGHFTARTPWYSYHQSLCDPLARLVGARPPEVVAMNGLTVNLHLLLVSFYRPTADRDRILIEEHAFPSDLYAVTSQLRWHGRDPRTALRVVRARPGESTLRGEEVEALLEREGPRTALVLLGAPNFFTGQWFDVERLGRAARRQGAVFGLDLAHAVGNVPLRLHDWDVDFAVWCSYKYLNGGPGAIAGAFVHERHHARPELPRLAGWWGNDPETRFRMEPEFAPLRGAEGWQVGNPPILAMAPLRASLQCFEEAGMTALRAKSEHLTACAEAWVDHVGPERIEILTPRDPAARGCQLSLRPRARARELFARLADAGVVADWREPDVIRIAPVPLYNSFHDVWRFGRALERWAG